MKVEGVMVFSGAVAERMRRMRLDDKDVKAAIKKSVRDELRDVRKDVMAAARRNIPNDPRKAYQGVKTRIYRDGNGGSVSLWGGGKVTRMAVTRKQRGGKSGIVRRRKVSESTKRREGYIGKDRSFILRFVEQGAYDRYAGTTERRMKKAWRGSIAPRKFFRSAAERSMSAAANRVARRIGEELVGKG